MFGHPAAAKKTTQKVSINQEIVNFCSIQKILKLLHGNIVLLIRCEKLRNPIQNERVSPSRARAYSDDFCPRNARFCPKSTFFYFFVQMTLKVVYIEYMNFLALKLNINPLYGWCAPLNQYSVGMF